MHRNSRLGDLSKPLSVPEPELTAELPCKDSDWEAGNASTQPPFTLSSPPESLGRYASVVQACYLLSRVLSRLSDTISEDELQMMEVEQLERTLNALIAYSESKLGTIHSIICYQTAISFS